MRSSVVLMALLALAACETANGSSQIGRYINPCDPSNVPEDQRATLLHQDRPGGSDCTRESAQRAYEAPSRAPVYTAPAPSYPPRY